MPIYEYECIQCGKNHEIIQKFSDAPIEKCPDCGGQLKKLISNTSFVLKGTGWYVTDYASKDKKTSAPRNGSDSKKTETTTEAKPETKKETPTTGQA
ncbi:MAG: FmdB family zinc ribbon protein [Thermodesulfovibrionales bacterium]